MGFSDEEIKKDFDKETKQKLRSHRDTERARDRRNVSDALESGRRELFLEALDKLGLVEGTKERAAAIQLFNKKHGQR